MSKPLRASCLGRARRPRWALAPVAAVLALTAQPTTPAASPRKQEITEHIERLQDADYQARCMSIIEAKRKLPGWVKNTDPEDGNGSGEINPCTDTEHVRTVFAGTFARTAGPPNEYVERFKVRARGELCLKVENDGVASARVWVDGQELLGPSDFSAVVTNVEAIDETEVGDHDLEVRVTSSPGASFTVEIRAALAADLAELVELFLQALADAGPSDAVVREAINAATVEGGALEPVQEVLGEIASGRSGNFASLTRAQSVQAYGIQSSALYQHGDPQLDSALDELTAIMLSDRAGSVRSAAAQAIGQLGHPDGVSALETALEGEPSPFVFLAIKNALVNLHNSLEEAS